MLHVGGERPRAGKPSRSLLRRAIPARPEDGRHDAEPDACGAGSRRLADRVWGRGYLAERARHHHVDTSCPGAKNHTTSADHHHVSEWLAYWREVVRAMNCPEVTDLELKRLAGNFKDRAESLIAIHDRQGELNCA